jgi:two-component system OmpR family sensor kinase/two-component system phosphate regulon sensor histidine kinase PhoR
VIVSFQYNREKEYKIGKLTSVLEDKIKTIDLYLRKHDIYDTKNYKLLNNLKDYNSIYEFRLTLINYDGTVLYDSDKPSSSNMDNHLYRPEIQESLTTDFGHQIRFSNTVGKDYFYYAMKLDKYFIRVSVPYNSELKDFLVADKTPIYFLLILLLSLVIILRFTTRYFGKMISSLSKLSNQLKHFKSIPEIIFHDKQLDTIGNEIIDIYNQLTKTEVALQNEKNKLVKHIQLSKEGIAFFSGKNEVEFTNPLFIQYLNTISDKKSTDSTILFKIPEVQGLIQDINNIRKENSLNNNILDAHPLKSIVIDKGSFYFEIRATVFADNSFEITIFDITKQVNQQMLKQEMTGNIAHELRTPISSIQGFLETILQNPAMEETQKSYFIERSFNQAVRLSNLVRDISMLNKMEETKQVIESETINISSVVKDVFLDLEKKLDTKSITFNYDFNTEAKIKGNYSLIYSVFRNLVDNTIKYAGKNNKIEIKKYLEDETHYYFSYYNSGEIIPEEHLNRIFERFYRIDKGRSRKEGGTGLGLAIVKNAVEIHGGVITAKNIKDKGLEFHFSFKK